MYSAYDLRIAELGVSRTDAYHQEQAYRRQQAARLAREIHQLIIESDAFPPSYDADLQRVIDEARAKGVCGQQQPAVQLHSLTFKRTGPKVTLHIKTTGGAPQPMAKKAMSNCGNEVFEEATRRAQLRERQGALC